MTKPLSYYTGHHWLGPGGTCAKCGAKDPLEMAVANGWLSRKTMTFDTEEHREQVEEALVCPEDAEEDTP